MAMGVPMLNICKNHWHKKKFDIWIILITMSNTSLATFIKRSKKK